MPKYTSSDVRQVAERLKQARDRQRPAHFLIGAGCSISANIPGAGELVKKIHRDYAEHCRDLKDGTAHSYGTCMALLTINERRDLIKPYLENAKINWGHVALAQLIKEGLIGRVLTVNFDMVLENACGLLGLQPAVYDFGVAPASDAAMIVSPAIVHLHGQSYGLVLLNTDEETRQHRAKLKPIVLDTLRSAPLVVIGYSGSADGVFQTLLEDFEGREALYWMGHDPDPSSHISTLASKAHARFLGGIDFDRVMIELAQSLGCWPPRLFSNPVDHLLAQIEPVVQYPVGEAQSEIDLLVDLRSKLRVLGSKFREAPRGFELVHDAFLQGSYEDAVRAYDELSETEKAQLEREQREIAVWSFIGAGNLLSDKAKDATGEQAVHLVAEAADKYRQALGIKPNDHEALLNWGNSLLQQARCAAGEEAARLFAEAADKYRQVLVIKPDSHHALYNWGNLLSDKAKRATGKETAHLFAEAGDKYRQALAIKPDKHEALNNWGGLLAEQAKRASGKEAEQLFTEAEVKLRAAFENEPGKVYNLACLCALRGRTDDCREFLLQGEKSGTLPSASHMRDDRDLESVRHEAWFKDLLSRLDQGAKRQSRSPS